MLIFSAVSTFYKTVYFLLRYSTPELAACNKHGPMTYLHCFDILFHAIKVKFCAIRLSNTVYRDPLIGGPQVW